MSIPKGETGSQRHAVKPGLARPCGRVSINSPAWANRSPDRALSKQDADQSTSEGNPLVAKEKTNTVAEAKRNILSAHGQSMSGSEQRQSVFWFMRPVLIDSTIGLGGLNNPLLYGERVSDSA